MAAGVKPHLVWVAAKRAAVHLGDRMVGPSAHLAALALVAEGPRVPTLAVAVEGVATSVEAEVDPTWIVAVSTRVAVVVAPALPRLSLYPQFIFHLELEKATAGQRLDTIWSL